MPIRDTKIELPLIVGILFLAAFFRFSLITETPPGLYPDEAVNGSNAREALRTGEFKVFYPENNGREGLFINLQAIAIGFLGAEPWVLRLVSAIFGTLTVLGIYLLTKELFASGGEVPLAALDRRAGTVPERSEGERGGRGSSKSSLGILNVREGTAAPLVAFLSAYFLATSYWHINFSRIGFRGIMVPFFATFGLYWLLKAIRTGKISSTILAGISTGLGFYTYIAFRFMPFVFLIPILFALSQWRRSQERRPAYPVSVPGSSSTGAVSAASSKDPRDPIKTDLAHREARRHGPPTAVGGAAPSAERDSGAGRNERGANGVAGRRTPCVLCAIALFLFITSITALPIGLHFFQQPQDFFGRGAQVSIFSAESPLREFIKSNALTVGMFNIRGDCNQRHNLACQPQLFWPVGILFLIGAALTVRDLFRRPLSPTPYTLAAWFLCMMFPATLTREGLPHALRAIGLIPPVMIFAGLGGTWFWQRIVDYINRARENPAYEQFYAQLNRIRKELAVVAFLSLVWIPVNTYRDYFVRFAYSEETRGAFAADLWSQGQYLARLPADTEKYVIVNLAGDDIRGLPAPAQTIMFATDTFDGERRRARRITYVRRPEDIRIDAAGQFAIIPMNPLDRELVASLGHAFPNLRPHVAGDILVFQK